MVDTSVEHKRVARDLLCGSLSGAIGIYLTQPIDTVRVIKFEILISCRSECK